MVKKSGESGESGESGNWRKFVSKVEKFIYKIWCVVITFKPRSAPKPHGTNQRRVSNQTTRNDSEALTGAAGQPGMTTSIEASWACGPRPCAGPARNRCKCAHDPDDDRTRVGLQ